MHFVVQKMLKLTYEHLEFSKIFRGRYPRTPVKAEWRGREGKGGEGEGRGGVCPLNFKCAPAPMTTAQFLCCPAVIGHDSSLVVAVQKRTLKTASKKHGK